MKDSAAKSATSPTREPLSAMTADPKTDTTTY